MTKLAQPRIQYKKGYKYKLQAYYVYPLRFISSSIRTGDWVSIAGNSLLVSDGYAWDGASGPALDTKNIIRASLVHDALYQLMREGALPTSFRKAADNELYHICREDGMWWIRAQWIYWTVRLFGKLALKHSGKVHVAP